jgi:energy-coupling factor transport system ATP-binding protein
MVDPKENPMHALDDAAVVVSGFSFAYAGAKAGDVAVRDVSFTVPRGSFCLLVGNTACGKTTLLRSMKPELAPEGERTGDIRVLGHGIHGRESDFSAAQSASFIGFVMQDPAAQIVCDTVWHELAFGLENLGTPQQVMHRRVAEVAHFFGIEPWISKKTQELSGGQRQLVNLAAVLALQPKILLLDEPTAQLDPNASKQFLFMLGRVNRELGTTIIMATHSPEEAAPYCTQRVDLSPVCEPVSKDLLMPYLRQRAAAASLSDSGSGETGIAIEVRDASFRFSRQDPWVLRGLNLQVKQGSIHAIVGGNGSGKTTLLRNLAGVLKPQRGKVLNRLAGSQALLPQDPKMLFVCDAVAQELAEWQERCGFTEADIESALTRFGLERFRDRHPYDLSGGQQQKLGLAKLLLTQPRLLFLDEPTKGLDPVSCAEVVSLLRALAAEGKTIVLVTHDLDFAYCVADEVSMIFDGEVACTEPALEFFRNNLVYRPNASSRLFAEVLNRECAAGGVDEAGNGYSARRDHEGLKSEGDAAFGVRFDAKVSQ